RQFIEEFRAAFERLKACLDDGAIEMGVQILPSDGKHARICAESCKHGTHSFIDSSKIAVEQMGDLQLVVIDHRIPLEFPELGQAKDLIVDLPLEGAAFESREH